MKSRIPKSYEEVEECLKHPKSHHSVVMIEVGKDKLLIMLNPFGGGSCNTQELKLVDSFNIKNYKLNKFMILESSLSAKRESVDIRGAKNE